MENLEKVLEYFCNFNDTSRIKIVMVDKDLSIINVLKCKLPNAKILLCKFHVMKYFKKKISDLDCKNIERQELGELIQKIIDSRSQKHYDALHEKLHKIESHNQKLKNYLSKHMNLPQAIEHLDKFLDDTYSRSSFNRYANLKTKIDVRNTDKDIIQYSLLCNSKAFQIVNDEYRMLDSMKFETEKENESYKVKYMVKGSSFDISVSKSMDECSCLTFCNFGLPCRHIFACRKQFKSTVYDESLIPDRWREEFEKQDGTEPVFAVQTSTIVNKSSLKNSHQPKSVIEKFNKAYDLCRDIAQFLSICGENEFQEKMSVLNSLKTEWQRSQITKGFDKDVKHQTETTPYVSDDFLTEYQYENVKMKSTQNSTNDAVSENNQNMETDDVIKCDIALETGEVKAEVPVQEQIENTDVLDLDDIRLDQVKCRSGRPKGNKKTFWNFSKKTSIANKKRKATEKVENASKKLKIQDNDKPNVTTAQNDQNTVWVNVSKQSLNLKDKIDIEGKELLNDKAIDVAQEIMKNQFTNPQINGFQSVLNKQRVSHFKKVEKDMVQILHRGSLSSGHWFTISTLNCPEGTVNVFDSMYTDLDQESKSQILSILKHDGKNVTFHVVPVQRQVGGTECGLFAIAFAVSLSFGLNPAKLIFDQNKMRAHLISCFTKQQFSNFPFNINTNWKKKKQTTLKEDIFCVCRGLYDSEMIQCNQCFEWHHFRCLDKQITNSLKKPDYQFKCSQCI